MKTEQIHWSVKTGWEKPKGKSLGESARLVLAFGATAVIKENKRAGEARAMYPKARIFGCSTAGEIGGTRVSDDSFVATAVQFEKTDVEIFTEKVSGPEDSRAAGENLADKLPKENLAHVFVLSDGLKVNGSALARGLTSRLPKNVIVTGGLAGDGARFAETYILTDDGPAADTVAVLGFYGRRLKIGCGSLGGWDTFGPRRRITKSTGNKLYELDGKSALDLYKKYLGEHAAGLPATGLLFPLRLCAEDGSDGTVRTILSVDENEKSMNFAGDIPEGAFAYLMKANFDRLVDGASGAAITSHGAADSPPADLAVLISCVGRKLILKQRVEEEVEAVRDVHGEKTLLTGFYSYGEIAPFMPNAKCELHNQTMTITTFSEI